MTEARTARAAGLASCHSCHLLSRLPADHGVCPRCGAHLHLRKPDSINRSWAYLIAAMILYVPANLLPVTHTVSLGSAQDDTIMSGVIYFFATGMWPIALIIFIASIFVPLLKMMILGGLLLSVHRHSRWRPVERTRFYRLTEMIGRWSMVDIYVVTILVALVKLGAFANIDAGPGAIFFALVVILTILAAENFDPRLIWDSMENTDDRHR